MLPKQSTPIYQTVIPSINKKINYRPFLVKDKKALMIAHMSNDPSVMINTLKNVISGCIEEDINVNSLASFDIEKLFCVIRSKSEGEVVELVVTCKNCNEKTDINLDVSGIDVKFDSKHKKKFILFENVGICMKYPSCDIALEVDVNNQSVDTLIELISKCVDYIYDDKKMYPASEISDTEMKEFIENLTEDQLNKIKDFFDTMPKFAHTLNFKCPHCQNAEAIEITGINSFF